MFFFFQAEDGIRDIGVTGVQTCALPILTPAASLVGLALRSGARVVLANQGKTPYDEAVTLRVWTGIGEVIPPAVERGERGLQEQARSEERWVGEESRSRWSSYYLKKKTSRATC